MKTIEEQVKIQKRLIKEYISTLEERKKDLEIERERLVKDISFEILKLNNTGLRLFHDKISADLRRSFAKVEKLKSEIEGLSYAIRWSDIIKFEEETNTSEAKISVIIEE